MNDINKFFSSLCHRHCWLSRTFYRTQISLIGLEKQSLLIMPFGNEKVTQFLGFPPTSVRATSHSTILDIPMRPLRENQKHRHRFTR